ncbi:MAG: trehalose-phosphatase [Nitrospiria bacterium]
MNLLTLVQSLENLKNEIRGKHLILFVDFDGTLLPIQRDPKKVFLSAEAKMILSVLSRTIPVTIISGRSLKELKRKVGIPEINLSGNHGLEIEGPAGFYLNSEAILSYHTITKVCSLLNDTFKADPGIFIEDKGLSLSIHYNQIPAERHSEINQSILFALRHYLKSNKIRVSRGKNVMEIRPPSDWGKEDAIRWILYKYQNMNPQKEYFPLYAGDDITDLNALLLVNRLGFALWVGDREAKVQASAFVSSSLELVDFLFWLNTYLKERDAR